ncbi:MAG: cysteine-rich CWC family protein [Burkholderiales bacterium]
MSAPTPPAIDPRLCPLCGKSNQCANEVERETGVTQPPCWCATAVFEPALLARIPAAARGVACVCARCGTDMSKYDYH